ncbi:MAG: prepilin-type N-terminal cleavage/methylation domain-containing protein [Verrucomicrobiota bacterium]
MSRARAFTLVEVLVSLAVFALAAVALGAAYVNLILAHDALRRTEPQDEALRLARRALLAEPKLDAAETGGEVVLADERTARWRAEIEPLPVADLFTVTLEVEVPAADGGSAEDHTEVHTLLRPTWSVEADRKQLLDDAKRRLDEERARL